MVVVDSGACPALPLAAPGILWDPVRHTAGSAGVGDALGHGSRCLFALIGAVRGRLAPGSIRVSPLDVFGPAGIAAIESVAGAVEGLVEQAPDYLVFPNGTPSPSPRLRRALVRLHRAGTRVYAAAGNPSAVFDRPLFPAGWPEVVCVGVESCRAMYERWTRTPDRMVDAPDTSTATMIAVAEDLVRRG